MRATDSMDTDRRWIPRARSAHVVERPLSCTTARARLRHRRAPIHRLRSTGALSSLARGRSPDRSPRSPAARNPVCALSVGRGSVPGRPVSGTFRADRDSAIPSTGPACADMRSSHSEIAYPNGTIPFAVQVPRHDYPRLRSCRSGNAPAPLTDRSGSQIYPRWNRGKPRESAPRLGGDHCHSAGTINIVSPRHEYHHSQQPTTALPVHGPPPSVRGNRS